jgi:hypothetical protein
MDREPDELLPEIEAFLRETGVAQTIFGRDEMGDPCFIGDLRGGRQLLRDTRERARAAMQRLREKLQEDKGNGENT